MSTPYVVLRAPGAAPAAPGLLSLRAAARPRVERVELTRRERRDLARDREVAAIAPVMPTRLPRAIAPAARAGSLWGLEAVAADRSPYDGAGVVVCVLDTGVDAGHEAFVGVDLIEEDFTGEGNGDRNGHGSHCAGVIFGREIAGERIGVAPGIEKAYVGKVLAADGSGSSDMIFEAMQWAIDVEADIVSMSLGFDFPGMAARLIEEGWPADLAASAAIQNHAANLRMFDALMGMLEARRAFGGAGLVIAAAGNESRREEHPNFEIAASIPAAAQGVISVGALGPDRGQGYTLAPFSNSGPTLSAPGVDIRSAEPGGGAVGMSGTSMACPHVAGIAALWRQKLAREGRVEPSAQRVEAALLDHCRADRLAPGIDVEDRGAGCVLAPLERF